MWQCCNRCKSCEVKACKANVDRAKNQTNSNLLRFQGFEAHSCLVSGPWGALLQAGSWFMPTEWIVAIMKRSGFSLKSMVLASVVIGFTGFAVLAQDAAVDQTGPEGETAAVKDDNAVIAIVNGYEIRTSEVRMAFDDVIGQLPNLPKKLRYPFVVEFLVERHLLAQLANKEGISDSDDYKRRLAAYQAKALRDSYLAQVISKEVTEEEITAVYEDEAKKLKETERVRARHILVASEKEANVIEEKLAKGEKFEALAKQFSLDGSKDYGGDLGYFSAPEMVPAFSKAAFALKKDEISKPVKTDFGWHIIRLEDRKQGAAQPYDQVKGAIRNVLVRQKVQAKLASLKDVAKVEIIDPDLKKVADEAAQQRKVLQEQQGKANVSQDAPQDEGASGKGDLILPDENQQ
jgi:peptidyl-prolyl cis-trans isomerase C